MHYNKILMIQEHVKVKREYELTDCAGFAVTSHGRSVITGRDQAQKMDLLGNSNLDRVGREKIQIWPCIHKGLKYGQSVKTIEHLTLAGVNWDWGDESPSQPPCKRSQRAAVDNAEKVSQPVSRKVLLYTYVFSH